MKRITLNMIAKMAGVSTITASRAISGHPYVREEVRQKVQDAVARLGYVPRKRDARKSGSRLSVRIGCVLFPSYNKYSEPFFGGLLEEIDRVLTQNNLRFAFFHDLRELEQPDLFLKTINPKVVDGCLLVAVGEQFRSQVMAIKQKVPHLVIMEDFLEDDAISCVYSDRIRAGYLATRHLIALGHKRIGCITSFFNAAAFHQSGLNGYKLALQEAGLAYDENLVKEGHYQIEPAMAATNALLKTTPRPTGIYITSDPLVPGVYKAILDNKLRVAEDVSVVSNDNIRASAYMHPALTTVGANLREMAEIAVQHLIEKISGKRKAGIKIILPVELIDRSSCQAPDKTKLSLDSVVRNGQN